MKCSLDTINGRVLGELDVIWRRANLLVEDRVKCSMLTDRSVVRHFLWSIDSFTSNTFTRHLITIRIKVLVL
ncbi:hypothetical protein TELCIR_16618, partial [Teladorsagia circumcincta]